MTKSEKTDVALDIYYDLNIEEDFNEELFNKVIAVIEKENLSLKIIISTLKLVVIGIINDAVGDKWANMGLMLKYKDTL